MWALTERNRTVDEYESLENTYTHTHMRHRATETDRDRQRQKETERDTEREKKGIKNDEREGYWANEVHRWGQLHSSQTHPTLRGFMRQNFFFSSEYLHNFLVERECNERLTSGWLPK
jgi:hypothetical protein